MNSSSNALEVKSIEQKPTLSSVVSDDSVANDGAVLKSSTYVDAGGKIAPKAVPSEQQQNQSIFNPLLALATLVAGEKLQPVPRAASNQIHQYQKPILSTHHNNGKTDNKTRKRKMLLPTKNNKVYNKKKLVPLAAKKVARKDKYNDVNVDEDDDEDDGDDVSEGTPRIVERTWNKNYLALVEYHKEHGHSNVLRSDPDKQLSGWVKRQRNNLKDGKLSPSKIVMLNELDFVWNRTDGAWYKKFCQLVVFEQRFGHSYVTARYDRSLAEWCQRQRREYANAPQKFSSERLQKLEALKGWSWNKRKTSKVPAETLFQVQEPHEKKL